MKEAPSSAQSMTNPTELVAVNCKLRDDYQAMARDIAAAALEVADASKALDLDKLGAAQERMNAATSTESPLIDAVNEFCQAR